MQATLLRCAVLLASGILLTMSSNGQTQQLNDPDEERIQDIITASHILANEGILDSFGHVTARSAKDPTHFFMPRAMAPALVSRADIVELSLDCKPIAPDAPRLNGELAAKLGANPVILMRGHGDTVVGRSVREATVRTIYTHIDALAQREALALSPNITAMNNAELDINATENFDADRPWQNYKSKLPAGH